MLNPTLQIQTKDANAINTLLEQAEAALAINNYEEAILLLERIVELKAKQKVSSIELADSYYDVGEAYFNGAKSSDKQNASEYILKSLHYLQLAKALYPIHYIDDIEACTKLISDIIANNEHLAMKAIKAPKVKPLQDDIDLLAHSSEALSRSDDKAIEEKKPKVRAKVKRKEKDSLSESSSTPSDNEYREKEKRPNAKSKRKNKITTKSPTRRFQYRAALIDRKLIKSVELEKMYLTFKLHSDWDDRSHLRSINKMFNEISKTRPLFREHLQLVRGSILKFLIIKPFENGTPETILDFICQQAKRDSSSFLGKLKKNELITHVEVDGNFAVFHIVDEHQSPEDLFKINSALYNRYIADKVFREHFGAPCKNDKTPRMKIKQPLQGLSKSEILNKLTAIINKMVASNLKLTTVDEQSLKSLTPVLSSSPATSFTPTTISAEQAPESEIWPFETPLIPSVPEFYQEDFTSLFNDQDYNVQPPLTYQYTLRCTPTDGHPDDDNDLLVDWGFRI